MVKAKAYIYKKRFDGLPKVGDFELIEEELSPLKEGEFIAEAAYVAIDAGSRAYANDILPLETTFGGWQVALVTESKNEQYPKGKYVVGRFGWRTHTISSGKSDLAMILPDFGELPVSLAVGVLGMPGNTAYFGFLEICKPKPGDTVLVTSAGGGVGSHVGQIAKIKNCKVIGVTGSAEKVKWLTEELGFDYAINYKTDDIDKALAEIAPDGIDCYFDNVGGELSSIVIKHMKSGGRIAACGAVSLYNEKNFYCKATCIQPYIIMKRLKMEGFVVYQWLDRWMEGINQNMQWIKEGKLKYKETVTEGLENCIEALRNTLMGDNLGKAVVKVK